MSMNLCFAALAGLAVSAGSPAAAAPEMGPGSTQAAAAGESTEPLRDPSDDAALSDEELDILRGGEALLIADQTLVAITSGNAVHGNYTAGNVTLSDFALSNFHGIGNLLINTGAQNSIQSGMNLTINVGP